MLYEAARLSFRNGTGPFRCLAKISFRPRAYQIVPLIMSLKQDVTRLLIADDVGIGKTVEALLIVKELLERRIIRRFAIVCLPHLCDQWQREIREKIGMDAVVIRSNTQARLDREIIGDTSVYQFYPFQIISIDYIKSDQRRAVFIQEGPEMVVVDEAHSCACPQGASKNQQQRHALVHDLAAIPSRHLILLTATPHSGKTEEFQSLLGLLDPQFAGIDLTRASESQRKSLARHYSVSSSPPTASRRASTSTSCSPPSCTMICRGTRIDWSSARAGSTASARPRTSSKPFSSTRRTTRSMASCSTSSSAR